MVMHALKSVGKSIGIIPHENNYGSINMVTEFPFYEPGNTVSGNIFVRAT